MATAHRRGRRKGSKNKQGRIDLTGIKHNEWMPFEEGPKTKGGMRCWWCRCSCPAATVRLVQQGHLIHGKSKSCGCLQKKRMFDLTGEVYGRWTVESEGPRTTRGERRWWAICSCEKKTRRLVKQGSLVFGRSRSCGCLGDELRGVFSTKHGMSKNREYQIWVGIIARCTNPRHRMYARYGGRGITVSYRWTGPQGFINMWTDLGPSPFAGASIDRIDNDGPYSPENCRWASPKEQAANMQRTQRLTLNGETLTLTEWESRTGLVKETIRARLRSGWTVERALTETPRGARPAVFAPLTFIA